MVDMTKKMEVITHKNGGKSNRETARLTGLNRETVSKYWEEYKRKLHELSLPGADIKELQDELTSKPVYKKRESKPRKYTDEIEMRLKEILKNESRKDTILGANHKQKMTNKQIHALLREEGYDIGIATIGKALARLRERPRNVYIRQQYGLGERLEYDFGEVKLIIGGVTGTYHMAVIASAGGKFRWLRLYTNQKKGVFMDSHVRFFEYVGGTYWEVVYDNMKNVVKKFIGKTEKELNPDLVKMSMYYGFKINVTNCFSGNEKGTVEKAVDVLRTELFTVNYTFNTLDDAQEYADSRLMKLNENSLIEEERKALLPYLPPLELGDITTPGVDKTSLINVDCVKYSVPEEFVGQKVTAKKYHNEIRVFVGNKQVCGHRRAFGNGTLKINIMHYLNTFLRKPGAMNNSVALKSIPKLKAIFDTYYKEKPKEFIEKEKTANKAEFQAISVVKPISQIDMHSRSAMANYALLMRGGAAQ
jgi:transposase